MGVVANTKMSLTPFSLFHRVAPPCECVKSEKFVVIKAYLLPLPCSQQRVVQGVQPFASPFGKRCIYAFLTTNDFSVIVAYFLPLLLAPTKGSTTSTALRCFSRRALIPVRGFSLLRLSNIGRGA